MNHETECQGTDMGCPTAGGASVLASRLPPSALDVGYSMFDVSPLPPPPPFDETRASQARSDLIQFTKIFFGLDNEYLSA
jgi:hypothetical protein